MTPQFLVRPERRAGFSACALLLAIGLFSTGSSRAMDHGDGPRASTNPSADLCDLYAWREPESDALTVVLTFDCDRSAAELPRYDADVLYTIHIDNTASIAEHDQPFDNDNDNRSDIDVLVRFGRNGAGEWGVRVEGLPGASEAAFSGPVQTVLYGGNGTQAIAGRFDDPSFMNREGLLGSLERLQSSEDGAIDLDLSYLAAPPDDLAGRNTMAIVLALSSTEALAGNPDSFLQIWATSRVFGEPSSAKAAEVEP